MSCQFDTMMFNREQICAIKIKIFSNWNHFFSSASYTTECLMGKAIKALNICKFLSWNSPVAIRCISQN